MNYLIIVIAIVVVGGVAYLIYRLTQRPRVSEEKSPETATKSSETILEAEEWTPPIMSETPEPSSIEASATTPESPENTSEQTIRPTSVAEFSSLTDFSKNQLMNAVWYRCENPRCNYTQFLDVHHIVSEVEGGTNRLDNLIVLCPTCHAAVHSEEISEEQLHSWIQDRAERFRCELDWPYK